MKSARRLPAILCVTAVFVVFDENASAGELSAKLAKPFAEWLEKHINRAATQTERAAFAERVAKESRLPAAEVDAMLARAESERNARPGKIRALLDELEAKENAQLREQGRAALASCDSATRREINALVGDIDEAAARDAEDAVAEEGADRLCLAGFKSAVKATFCSSIKQWVKISRWMNYEELEQKFGEKFQEQAVRCFATDGQSQPRPPTQFEETMAAARKVRKFISTVAEGADAQQKIALAILYVSGCRLAAMTVAWRCY